MKITNDDVYGLYKSIVASGLPKAIGEPEYNLNRAGKLGNCKHGSGHDSFMKGIVVQCDVTAPSYWWPQFQRYHFADIISSQSKMHSLLKFDINEQCNEYVVDCVINYLKKLITMYNDKLTYPISVCYDNRYNYTIKSEQEHFQYILSNCPMGLNLTARITTNYLQLKTIYFQRKNHRLEEWKIFIDWIRTLPLAEELIFVKI